MKPRIFLLSRPQFDIEMFLSFLAEEKTEWQRSPQASSSEEIVEAAGRICYMSFGGAQSPRDNREYILNLILSGHESVLEHVSWTFLLAGVSRAFTHQLVRHRVGIAFSQLSQQYHEETNAEFVEPDLLGSPQALHAWREAMTTVQAAYRTIMASLGNQGGGASESLSKKELKRAIRSAARSVLPNATETKIVMTANARALRHLFSVRGSIPGDLEMRQVMGCLFQQVQPEAPALFMDFRLDTMPDGTFILRHKSKGT